MKTLLRFAFAIHIASFLVIGSSIGCSKLQSAKGSVIDILAKRPITGARVVATTSSDIEAEQPHLRFSTKTDQNGNFVIKGLPRKNYRIKVMKNGYTQAQTSVTIPEKSTRLIKKPLELCPLPPEKGVFVYADDYVKLTKSIPYKSFNRGRIGRIVVYYEAESLKDIPPVSPRYLIKYGSEWSKIQKMYWLFRRTAKEELGEAESSGKYYTMGGYHTQFAKTYGSFSIDSYYGRKAEFRRSGSDKRKNHYWGSLECVFYDRDSAISVYEIINRIPKGYYFLGYGNRYHFKKTMPTFLLNLQ